jgi:hypothetical protein
MLIKQSEQSPIKGPCDLCGTADVEHTEHYAYIARGATGRWCEVLWVCDVCGSHAEHVDDEPVMTAAQAREYVTNFPEWADF